MTRTPYVLSLLLAALLAAAAVVAPGTLTPPAHAHAGLVDSDPADGATIPQFSDEVVLTFSEDVQGPVTVIVTDPEGTGLQDGDPVVNGPDVRQPVDPATVAGQHTIAYRVISADGHPITGQPQVAVDDPAPESDPSQSVGESESAPAELDEATSTGIGLGTVVLVAVLVLLVVTAGVALARRKKP